MWKKLVLLLVVVLFAFGASGGCIKGEPPNLIGTWKGTLSRALDPTIPDFADVTIYITDQDSSGRLTGKVTVTYKSISNNPPLTTPITLPDATITRESSTDAFIAKITAEGTNNTGSDIVISYGVGNFIINNGGSFTFKFEIPHLYACRGGDLTELVGGYTLICSDVNLDSGGVNLTKQP